MIRSVKGNLVAATHRLQLVGKPSWWNGHKESQCVQHVLSIALTFYLCANSTMHEAFERYVRGMPHSGPSYDNKNSVIVVFAFTYGD